MKADCKKCKHCMQIHGREVMCRRFLADGTEIEGFIRMLGTITRPTYCVYFEKKEQEVQWLEFTINQIVEFVHICVQIRKATNR